MVSDGLYLCGFPHGPMVCVLSWLYDPGDATRMETVNKKTRTCYQLGSELSSFFLSFLHVAMLEAVNLIILLPFNEGSSRVSAVPNEEEE